MQSKSYSDDVNSNIQNNNLIYLSKTDYKKRVFFNFYLKIFLVTTKDIFNYM